MKAKVEDEDGLWEPSPAHKRRKLSVRPSPTVSEGAAAVSLFGSLVENISPDEEEAEDEREQGYVDFEDLIEDLLPDLLRAESGFLETRAEHEQGLYPLTRRQAASLAARLSSGDGGNNRPSPASYILRRKLASLQNQLRRDLLKGSSPEGASKPLTPLPKPSKSSNVNPQVLDALYAIRTTPFENSLLSRLHGFRPARTPGLIAVDWETQSPWMQLMEDVREHYSFAYPEREQPVEARAPIEYVWLQSQHLRQVHDLLARIFWEGINVSDALDHSPERCTIIATYKKLVVGAAFLSSPHETYITYLAVRAGWENAHIATSMLYYLITANPNRDITLHVSINNPAMLLYNRFGFKAEEFIVGFYEDYLDPQSRASKNAFRLRLRA